MSDVPPPPPPPASGAGGGSAGVPPGPPPTSTTPTTPSEPPAGESTARRGLVIGVVVAILAGLGVAGFFALRDDGSSAGPSDTIEPEESVPEEPDPTIPEVTVPAVTSPELSLPELTVPSVPELTLPSLPTLSIPPLSIPERPGTLAPPGSIPESSEPPDGLGTDAALDALAQDCFDGDMDACDELYSLADEGSDYRRYGDTCAGRQPENTQVYCTAAFPS